MYRQHVCPHKSPTDILSKSEKPCHHTEYSTKYKKYENQTRRSAIRPPRKLAEHDAKMVSDTTNRKEFVAYPVTPPTKKPPVQFQPPQEAMESSTEYKNVYLGKWQAPTEPIVPSRSQNERTEPFDDSTTHAIDFTAPPVTPRELHTAQNNYEPPTATFDDISTAHSDFIHYGKVPVTPSLAPPLPVKDKGQPIEGVTSYNSNFVVPPMPKKIDFPKETYVPSKEKISDVTTFKASFPQYPDVKPREMKKPVSERCNTDIPFESRTTSRMHYVPWDLPKKYSRPPTAFVPPTERVSDVTTHRSDFADYGHVLPTASSRPVHKRDTQVVPFDSLTTQNADYRAWDGVRRPEPVRQDKEYEPPQEKFDPTTTFSTNFKGTFASRPPSARPPQPTSTSSKIDFTTSYNSTFSGPGYQLCRSIPLLTNDTKASKYVYSHDDSFGHKYYRPTKDGETVKASV